MKKLFSLFISFVMIMSITTIAFASAPGANDVLKFDENGEFKILNIYGCV